MTKLKTSRIKTTLDIHQEGGEGSYLGLPESFSGSKRKLLSFLRENLQNRVQGWYAKSLSQGGKEVLLKSIGLGLPVFAMSVFKLPKDVCAKLTSAMVEFWWSSGSQKKKLPWVAWSKLCKPKCLGGIGFKDIERFNQSLLGKQAWRIWDRPDSLLARILKQRYFQHSSILDCGVGRRPSYAWRSILYGRDLFNQGLISSIGDGSNTQVWTDNWLLDKVPRPPRYNPNVEVDLSLKVSDLILHDRGIWNAALVRRLIHPDDVDLVLNLQRNVGSRDRWIWSLTRYGSYSSKSGYQLLELLQEVQGPPAVTLPPIEKALWTNIWKTKTSPKLRHFLWRMLSGALAVRSNLQARGIAINPTCTLCNTSPETICHSLFLCAHARKVWEDSGFPIPLGGFSVNSVMLNVHHLVTNSKKHNIPKPLRLSFPWLLWSIWKSRNSFVFERRSLDPSLTLSRGLFEADTWLSLHSLLDRQPDQDPQVVPIATKWIKPPGNVLKCNVGSAWCAQKSFSGAAWIVRDHQGCPSLHSRRAYANMSSALEADLWSLYWAVESLGNLRFKNIIFEFSSSVIREAMLNPERFPAFRVIMSQIMSSLSVFDSWSLDFVVEARNQVASQVALSVIRDGRLQFYIARNGPSWLSHLIAEESREC